MHLRPLLRCGRKAAGSAGMGTGEHRRAGVRLRDGGLQDPSDGRHPAAPARTPDQHFRAGYPNGLLWQHVRYQCDGQSAERWQREARPVAGRRHGPADGFNEGQEPGAPVWRQRHSHGAGV